MQKVEHTPTIISFIRCNRFFPIEIYTDQDDDSDNEELAPSLPGIKRLLRRQSGFNFLTLLHNFPIFAWLLGSSIHNNSLGKLV